MLQSIIVPKNKFTKRSAIDWIVRHKYHIYKIDETKNFWRIRQKDPKSHGQYYTIKLNNGIELVYEKNI